MIRFPPRCRKKASTSTFSGRRASSIARRQATWRACRPARAKLGFAPVIPRSSRSDSGPGAAGGRAEDFRFAAIRLTTARESPIYQWRARRGLAQGLPGAEGYKNVKGVRFRLVGDLPEPAKMQFLELFLKEPCARSRAAWNPSPALGVEVGQEELMTCCSIPFLVQRGRGADEPYRMCPSLARADSRNRYDLQEALEQANLHALVVAFVAGCRRDGNADEHWGVPIAVAGRWQAADGRRYRGLRIGDAPLTRF